MAERDIYFWLEGRGNMVVCRERERERERCRIYMHSGLGCEKGVLFLLNIFVKLEGIASKSPPQPSVVPRIQLPVAAVKGSSGERKLVLLKIVKRRSTCPQPIHNRLEGISVEGQLVKVEVKLWLRTNPCTKLREVEVFKLVQHRIGRGARSNDGKPVGQAGEREKIKH
jgi:hypothetical protein